MIKVLFFVLSFFADARDGLRPPGGEVDNGGGTVESQMVYQWIHLEENLHTFEASTDLTPEESLKLQGLRETRKAHGKNTLFFKSPKDFEFGPKGSKNIFKTDSYQGALIYINRELLYDKHQFVPMTYAQSFAVLLRVLAKQGGQQGDNIVGKVTLWLLSSATENSLIYDNNLVASIKRIETVGQESTQVLVTSDIILVNISHILESQAPCPPGASEKLKLKSLHVENSILKKGRWSFLIGSQVQYLCRSTSTQGIISGEMTFSLEYKKVKNDFVFTNKSLPARNIQFFNLRWD